MMAAQRVSDMTLDDLRTFVEEVVDHRLQALLKPADRRSIEEINESIRRNRWTPPPGTPSTLELLREDRDQ
jgi:uncharacterized membrane-anchored protein YjiN (DUF445 family)